MGTYYVQTIGCQMNERDSETIAGLLEQMGYTEASGQDDADVLFINTCSVRENADNRFFGLLGQLKHIKTKRPDAIVAVCGCMMQQEHIVNQIKDKHAWVDIIFGTHNISAVPELIDAVLKSRETEEVYRKLCGKPAPHTPATQILDEREGLSEGLPAKRAFSYKASVNIMYGCNNYCTYCIVPYTRGREINRDIDAILAEVHELAEAGTKEIMLLGQNVNSYKDKEADFADLIAMVDKVPGIERIRFMTSHPKDLSDKLIERFSINGPSRAAHLCPAIHLPIQSGSSRVLDLMNRRYTKEGYIGLVEKLREARPGIVISTDFIVGFPGEAEEDFEHTMDVIERVRFDAAFTFLYSPRTGTPAAEYEDKTPADVKQKRFDRMVKRLNEITLEINQTYVGTVQDVLVEGPSKTNPAMLSGRTFGNKLVNFPPPLGCVASLAMTDKVIARSSLAASESDVITRSESDKAIQNSMTGTIVPVRITSVKTFSFTGEIADGD